MRHSGAYSPVHLPRPDVFLKYSPAFLEIPPEKLDYAATPSPPISYRIVTVWVNDSGLVGCEDEAEPGS
jgi:hypothetical protein